MTEPAVTWYANNRRAAVTFPDGEKWWISPGGNGEYIAVCDETETSWHSPTMQDALDTVLGGRQVVAPPVVPS